MRCKDVFSGVLGLSAALLCGAFADLPDKASTNTTHNSVFSAESPSQYSMWTEPQSLEQAEAELAEKQASLAALEEKMHWAGEESVKATAELREAQKRISERRVALSKEDENVRVAEERIRELENELIALRTKLQKMYAEDEVILNALAMLEPAKQSLRETRSSSASNVHQRRRLLNRVGYLERWVQEHSENKLPEVIEHNSLEESVDKTAVHPSRTRAVAQEESRYEK